MQPYRIATDAERAAARYVRIRDATLRMWLNGRNSYRDADVPAVFERVDNAERSAAEVTAFLDGAVKPGESYVCYLADSGAKPGESRYRLTTWVGDTLATVTSFKSRRQMRGYTTDVCGSFWARGIDGRTYYGTHNGPGMYARMRLAKNQPTRGDSTGEPKTDPTEAIRDLLFDLDALGFARPHCQIRGADVVDVLCQHEDTLRAIAGPGFQALSEDDCDE